ncbi:MAG: cation:dicarboxylate symporter family transporter [Leptospirillia bacterium]
MARKRTLFSALESLHPRSMTRLSDQPSALVRERLWLKVLIGMVLGLATGTLLGPTTGLLAQPTTVTVGNWLALPGRFFLALIQMIVIPLVFASVIRGLAASENVEQLRKVGVRVVLVFVVTTALAAAIGIGLALSIRPGLAMVLGSVGIPVAGLALLMGVDRILDMSRTAINVAGDLATCMLMDRWLGNPETAAGPKPVAGPEEKPVL